jgi:hypothetical protein
MERQRNETQFRVMIDYRTKRGLATWAGMVSAATFDEARELAERQICRRLCRSLIRIDRVVVN